MPQLQQTGETFVVMYAALKQPVDKGPFSSGVISKRLHIRALYTQRRQKPPVRHVCGVGERLALPSFRATHRRLFSAQST